MNPWESPDIKTRRRHAYIGYTPDRSVEVPYPWQFSEFEVQAKLYARLVAMGLNVRGNVPASFVAEKGAWMEDVRVVFDLVVYDSENNAICIIECKNSEERREPNPHSRQYLRYTRFNAELIWHFCHQDAEFTCERVRKAIDMRGAK